jgi:hypothetical protein
MIKKLNLINLNTLLCSITIGILLFYYQVQNQNKILYKIENDPGRNEGSTPRTFVLPATPAVAEEQERKQLLLLRKPQIQKCMFKLFDLGYKELGSFDDIFDIKITIALINYQRANNLKVSGKFDLETMKILDCNEK